MKEFIKQQQEKAREDFNGINVESWMCSKDKSKSKKLINYKDVIKVSDQLIADTVKATLEEVGKNYNELLLAVENKYKGKTRHETALMLIKNAQSSSMGSAENNKLNELN